MKEKIYIVTKFIKKQAIPLLLISMAMVLFFVNFLNRPVAYASEQIASVRCDVCLVDGENVKMVSSDAQLISSLESSVIDFSDINVEIGARSKLEFNYYIENISSGEVNYGLTLNENLIKNFKIEFYVNNVLNGDLTNFNSSIESLDMVEIKVVVYVDNILSDAMLNGSLNLTFESVGGDNGQRCGYN